MKKIALIAAMGLMGMGSAMAQSTSVPAAFNVIVNLSSQCKVKTAAGSLDFGTYTAFGSATAATPSTSVVFECTRGLAPNVAFDTIATTSTTAAAGQALSAAAPVTGEGVVVGLLYTLSVVGTASAGSTAVAGTGGTGGTTGMAQERTYTITGGMPSGQAGNCTTANCSGNQPRQLIVSY